MKNKRIFNIFAIVMSALMVFSGSAGAALLPQDNDIATYGLLNIEFSEHSANQNPMHGTIYALGARTIYVPDDYPTIQGAVDAANPGDKIIVRAGTFIENVNVNKSRLVIKSEKGPEVTIVQAANRNDHVFHITADRVIISGFTVTGATARRNVGIGLEAVSRSTIVNNIVTGNYGGIGLARSHRNIIRQNIITGNRYGIGITGRATCAVAEAIYGTEITADPEGTLNVLRNLRDKTLRDKYVDLFYKHSPEVTRILIENPLLLLESARLIMKYMPAVRYVLGLGGKDLEITEQDVTRVVSFIRELSSEINERKERIGIERTSEMIRLLQELENEVKAAEGQRFSQAFRNSVYYIGNEVVVPHSPAPNHIYLNNFVNNHRNFRIEVWGNAWNSSRQLTYTFQGEEFTSYMGNYWDDYRGVDADGDGIGDTHHAIGRDRDRDRFPLMKPFENYGDPRPVIPMSAKIVNYTVSPRNIVAGDNVTIGFTFINTGDDFHIFGAKATLRNPEGARIELFESIMVIPGQVGSAEWSHPIDMAGRWDVKFTVWEESIHPLRTLLVQTGWVPEYITAREEGPGIVAARIDRHTVYPTVAAVGDKVTIGFTFTNTFDVTHTFGAGATLRRPDGERIDFLTPVTLAPGQSGSVQWTHTIDMIGRWDIVFGVWEESTHPLQNLLVQTGWVPESIIATLGDEHNAPPRADFTYVVDGLTVRFTSTSTDPDDNIISYHWEFGDGRTSGERNPIHIYRIPFWYYVVHTVEDAHGRSSSVSKRVWVPGGIFFPSYPPSFPRGVYLPIGVIALERGLLVTVSIGDITKSGTTQGIIPSVSFNIDTSEFTLGRHELTIDVDGLIYKSWVDIFCGEVYRKIMGKLEGLRTAAEVEMWEISSYPARALAKKVLYEVANEIEGILGEVGGDFVGELWILTALLELVGIETDINKVMRFFCTDLPGKILRLGERAEFSVRELITKATQSIFTRKQMEAIRARAKRTEDAIPIQELVEGDIKEINRILRTGAEAIRNISRERIYRLDIPLVDIPLAEPTMFWFRIRHIMSLNAPCRLWRPFCRIAWVVLVSSACFKSVLTFPAWMGMGWITPTPDDKFMAALATGEIRPAVKVPAAILAAYKAVLKIKVDLKAEAFAPYVITAGMFLSVDLLADEVKETHGEIMEAIDRILKRGAPTAFARPLFRDGALKALEEDIILTLTPTGKIVGFDFVQEGERLRVPPEYRMISLGARESFRIAAQEPPQITMQLAPERETYELGETARITVTMRNDTAEPLENLLLSFFVPEEGILITETVNLAAHSEVVWYHEFQVTQRMVYAPVAFLTQGGRIIAEDVTSFVVGGVKQRRAFITIDYAEFSDPGLIEMTVRVENVGNIAINPYLTFGGTFGKWTIYLRQILPQTSITETVSFRIIDPGIYTAYFILTEGAKTLHTRQADFTVRAIDTLLASVSTDRAIYNLGDTVQVSVVVENAVFQVVEVPYELEIITPSGQVMNVLTFVAQEAGTYIVRATPIAPGFAVVSDETLFIVERQSDLIIEASLEEKALLVRITTDAGGPVGGVRVTANNLVRVTDKEGMAKFEYVGIKEPFLRAERIGFNPTMVAMTEPPAPFIYHTPLSFTFTATEGGANPAEQTLAIRNVGGGTLNWSVISDDAAWLSLVPTSGSSTGETDNITVAMDIAGLTAGTYTANITITAPGAANTPQTVPVTLTITVRLPGDVNEDGVVDAADLALVAAALNSRPGTPNWNPAADLNQDGIVDIFDLVLVGRNFGKGQQQ